MFRKRLFAGSIWVGLFSSAAFIIAVVYIPIYVQGVLGGSATDSGLTLLPMMLGSSVSAPLGGNLASKMGYRKIMFVSCTVFAVGIYLLSTLTVDTSRWMLMLYMVLVGLGIGPSFSVLGMAGMHHFDERQRGAAGATQSFIRELGMTVGITVFGIMQRNLFKADLKMAFGGMSQVVQRWQGADPHAMLSPETRTQIPALILDKLKVALASSIADTFAWTMILAVLALLFVFWLSKERWEGFRQSSRAPVND